jgi:kinesin family protein 11
VTSTYAAGASTQLSSARAAAQALLADGTREDVPTGATPQKRRWEYADSWARTKGRDALLREHHAGELGSGLRTELAPAAEDAPAEAGAEEVEPEGVELNSPASDVPPPPPYEDVPSAKPAHSRTSSTASAVPTTRAAPAKRALALPKAVAGTLTERPANMLAGRRRLR